MIGLSILINCLLDNEWILLREVTCYSLLEVKRLIDYNNNIVSINQSLNFDNYHQIALSKHHSQIG